MGESGIRGKVGAIHFRFSTCNRRQEPRVRERYVKSFIHQQAVIKRGPIPSPERGCGVWVQRRVTNILGILGLTKKETEMHKRIKVGEVSSLDWASPSSLMSPTPICCPRWPTDWGTWTRGPFSGTAMCNKCKWECPHLVPGSCASFSTPHSTPSTQQSPYGTGLWTLPSTLEGHLQVPVPPSGPGHPLPEHPAAGCSGAGILTPDLGHEAEEQ